MKLNICVLLFLLDILSHYSNGAKIFGFFPTPSISHQVVFRALIEELAKRGHEIVVLTTDAVHYDKPEFQNLTEIDVHNVSYDMWRSRFNFAMEHMKDPTPISVLASYMDIMVSVVDKQLSHPSMVKLLNDPEAKFDLCIVEGILSMNIVFKDRFNCSLIQFNSFAGLHQNYHIFGSPTHPSLYFDIFNPYDSEDLDLWKKFQLFKQRLQSIYIIDWEYLPLYENLLKQHFGPNVRPIKEMESDVDIIFQNYHPVIFGIRPLVPAIIYMGSMHIKPEKPLPSDLQTVMDGARNGVIYFSLGSNVRSCDLPPQKVNEILQAFKTLPYVILWKWENDELPNKPENVFIQKWFPQTSVLAHPNVKLFITQCGQQSMEESIHYGVPMLGIPFLADQSANVVRIKKHGIGKRLLIETLDSENLKSTIQDIITNTSFSSNIKKLKDLIHDEPQTSLERGVWWTEYVIRHRGAKHLRAPAANMSLLEYYLIYDVAKILAVSLSVIIISVKILF